MKKNSRQKILIGISSCLLGEKVRYDGSHKLNRLVTEVLSDHFDFLSICPEVAIGLGVPRPVIRLQQLSRQPRALLQDAEQRDITGELHNYGCHIANNGPRISGYILKSKSPSCGVEGVKLYDGNGVSDATASGIYAGALMSCLPLLPMEEECRLADPDLRDNFIERVFIYSHWQSLERDEIDMENLIRFHSQYKFLIMARDQKAMRQLGYFVANAKGNIESVRNEYITLLMATFKKPVTRGNQVNVLQHIAGFFKKVLDEEDRQELHGAIEAYRKKQLSIIDPLALIRYHLRRNPDSFLQNQAYLDRVPPGFNSGI